MTEETCADAASAAPDDMLRLLRLLARTGALVSVEAGGAFVVSAPGRATVLVPRALWQPACSAQWIAHDESTGWRITAAGREHLRRGLSRAGAPEKCTAAAPAPATTPRMADARPGIDLKESPLAWLARRQSASGESLISPAQLMAGERFRADFWFAGMSPRVTASWSHTSTGSRSRKSGGSAPAHQSDAMLGARERVRLALAAVGPELSGILIDVCGHLKGLEEAERQAAWPKRSAKLVLGLSLSALARHYGYIVTAAGQRRKPSVQHWGAPGYRPPADQPGSDAERT